jgi:hypothetical protein
MQRVTMQSFHWRFLRIIERTRSHCGALALLILAIACLGSGALAGSPPLWSQPPSETDPTFPVRQPLTSQQPWQSPFWPAPQTPSAKPQPPLPPGVPRIAPTMQFVRVVSAWPGCQPNCPEWLSAEGQIDVGTAQTFARFVAGLAGRRLPILINSPGGSTADAMAMGRLIRAQRLVVAVAHTELSPCAGGAAACAAAPGKANVYRALCVSACTLVLAGGVERYTSARSSIGVHQIRLGPKTIVTRHYLVQYRTVDGRKEEISRSLAGQDKVTLDPDSKDLAAADAGVANYLKAMGIGEPVMSLMLSTPAAAIHLMSYDELVTSRLETIGIFDFLASLGDTPDGLTGEPVGSSPTFAGDFSYSNRWPIFGPVDGRAAALTAQFRYRPGGGAVLAAFKLIDPTGGAGFPQGHSGSYVFANASDAPISWTEPEFTSGANGWIPRDVFCRLRGSRRAFVEFAEPSFEPSSDERRREHLARVDFVSTPAAAALFAEACSGPIAAARR